MSTTKTILGVRLVFTMLNLIVCLFTCGSAQSHFSLKLRCCKIVWNFYTMNAVFLPYTKLTKQQYLRNTSFTIS